jgi:hypothetical protein
MKTMVLIVAAAYLVFGAVYLNIFYASNQDYAPALIFVGAMIALSMVRTVE